MENSMRDIILNQHEQITHSLEVNKDVSVSGDFDSIIVSCIGGSGHPGDLLNALGLPTVPLYVHRNYDLPLDYLSHLGLTKPLVIASSFSGNTEEPLTGYQHARQESLPLLVSTSGGKLKEWAKRDNVPTCTIDFAGMQPRHTLLAAFAGMYLALKNSGLAEDIVADLNRVADQLKDRTPQLEEQGREIAEQIKGKTPVFMSTDNLGFAAKNMKIQTNENAKHPAFWSTFPELNHNEMVGFSELATTGHTDRFIGIFLKDPADHVRNQARMVVTKSLYEKWGITVAEYTAQGETLLEKLFTTVTLGLWVTSYLAVEYDIDPVPVAGVEEFKTRLTEVAGEV